MKVLVVDDELLARKRLRRMLEAIDGVEVDVEVIGEADNGEQALERARALKPDLVLMDIQMPVMNGLDAARELAREEPAPALVFCTAYDRHALAAFEARAVDYLLKPVERDKLARALSRARRLNQAQLQGLGAADQQGWLVASGAQGVEKISVSKVRYCRADQKYVTVIHPDGELLLSDSLTQLEQDWPGRFVRVHRNTLVAVAHLRALERRDGGYVAVIDGVAERPAVSRRHVSEVKAVLQAVHKG